jgi:hypothetical protein
MKMSNIRERGFGSCTQQTCCLREMTVLTGKHVLRSHNAIHPALIWGGFTTSCSCEAVDAIKARRLRIRGNSSGPKLYSSKKKPWSPFQSVRVVNDNSRNTPVVLERRLKALYQLCVAIPNQERHQRHDLVLLWEQTMQVWAQHSQYYPYATRRVADLYALLRQLQSLQLLPAPSVPTPSNDRVGDDGHSFNTPRSWDGLDENTDLDGINDPRTYIIQACANEILWCSQQDREALVQQARQELDRFIAQVRTGVDYYQILPRQSSRHSRTAVPSALATTVVNGAFASMLQAIASYHRRRDAAPTDHRPSLSTPPVMNEEHGTLSSWQDEQIFMLAEQTYQELQGDFHRWNIAPNHLVHYAFLSCIEQNFTTSSSMHRAQLIDRVWGDAKTNGEVSYQVYRTLGRLVHPRQHGSKDSNRQQNMQKSTIGSEIHLTPTLSHDLEILAFHGKPTAVALPQSWSRNVPRKHRLFQPKSTIRTEFSSIGVSMRTYSTTICSQKWLRNTPSYGFDTLAPTTINLQGASPPQV